jgi:ribosome-associated heat shock protein Hsp15
MTEKESIRLDKWLWAARFYKTRKLAADAVSGGKVHVNNQRSKPGKEVKPGTHLFISKGSYTWDITVLAINNQRRPAKEAILLYEETPDSITNRHTLIAQQREERTLFEPGREHKPNKKQRRQIHRFKQS